jgi:molecular chaperone DnaK
MVKDAAAHAEEDKAKKDEIEIRNQTDSLAYSTEQTLNELGDKVPAGTKSDVEAALAEAKSALQGTDIDAIKAAGEKLQQVGYKLAEIVYSDQQDQTAPGSNAQNGGDDVVDAEYEVVDE